MAETLVKRRLSVLKELFEEYRMSVTATWVDSAKNQADSLTRVPRSWLEAMREDGSENDQEDGRLCCMAARAELVAKQHGQHHLGCRQDSLSG